MTALVFLLNVLLIISNSHVERLRTLSDTWLFSQASGAVRSVAVWVIVSQTVPSWRPCRPSRSPTSGGKTTWLTAQWTSNSFSVEGGNVSEETAQLCRDAELRKCIFIITETVFSSVRWFFFLNLFLPKFCHTCLGCVDFVIYIFDTPVVNKSTISVDDLLCFVFFK